MFNNRAGRGSLMCARRVAGPRSRALVVVPLLLAAALTGLGPGTAFASTCGSGTGQPARPGSQNRFFSVAVFSCQAWAVGDYVTGAGDLRTLIERWNGTAWTRVPSPSPASAYNDLFGVAATSATSAWAVGEYSNHPASLAFHTLAEHWNGTAWTRVPSPSPGGPTGDSLLHAVAATSASDAWAVGGYDTGSGTEGRTLAEHWDGTAWTRVPSPTPGGTTGGATLTAVAATSPSDAWAVGQSSVGALIEHWNGTAWTQVPSPVSAAVLAGVAATSARDAWAVGYYHTPGALRLKTLVEHWNGTAWTQVPSLNPSPAPFTNRLTAVAATSPSDVWAVGDYISSARPHATLTLVEHWNGTTWTQVPSPSPSPGPGRFNDLDGVAANSASNAWAVGEYVTSSQAQQALAFHCC